MYGQYGHGDPMQQWFPMLYPPHAGAQWMSQMVAPMQQSQPQMQQQQFIPFAMMPHAAQQPLQLPGSQASTAQPSEQWSEQCHGQWQENQYNEPWPSHSSASGHWHRHGRHDKGQRTSQYDADPHSSHDKGDRRWNKYGGDRGEKGERKGKAEASERWKGSKKDKGTYDEGSDQKQSFYVSSFYKQKEEKRPQHERKQKQSEMDLVATETTETEGKNKKNVWRSGRVEKQKAMEKEGRQETAAASAAASPRPAEKQGGKKEKSGGWGDGLTREVKISKTLTQILRHKAVELKIDIGRDGYCSLRALLQCPWLAELEVQEEEVQQVVKKSDKKRFELKEDDGELLIRAVQGHSIKTVDDDQLLQKLDLEDTNLPNVCVHGTYRRHFDSIRRVGLLAGGGQGQGFRNHVHFSPCEPGDKRVISGMRYDCEIAIWIDLKRAIADNVPFYMSTNKVILSPGIDGVIDKKYFTKARDLQKKEDLDLSVEPESGA
ncbi:tRNA 2'-phosphotransferase 1 [Durusdinium trenchii]|uniref:2'-phosphotransferase n=1 Tax=Durusdinium trenchii TaxID=1381693 RepID=A0ABP0HNS2_9DINO